ncbi:MAG: ABC transporter permease [Ruthenibacterium lactatiformans]
MVTRWKRGFRREMNRYWDLYLLLVPVVFYFIIFKFWPMYGVQIAFKDFSPSKGIFDSPWVGFKHFLRFFNSFNFWDILRNTITISFYQLIAGFPIPILLALVLNEMRNAKFKKLLQTVTYAPHFLSTVVLVGMLTAFLNPSTGLVNRVIEMLGGEAINFMAEESWFSSLYVWSGVWQNAGWGTIIYMASLSSIDVQLYEAATIDGASRFKKLLHVTLPSIVPTAVTMLILDCGRIMNIGFEKAFLMQNDLNINRSEVISTYVYQVGITQAQYSYSTAVDLFNAVINVILLLVVNKISKKLTQTSLW